MKAGKSKRPIAKPLSASGKAPTKPTIQMARLSPADQQRVMNCRSRREFNRLAAEFAAGEPNKRRS